MTPGPARGSESSGAIVGVTAAYVYLRDVREGR